MQIRPVIVVSLIKKLKPKKKNMQNIYAQRQCPQILHRRLELPICTAFVRSLCPNCKGGRHNKQAVDGKRNYGNRFSCPVACRLNFPARFIIQVSILRQYLIGRWCLLFAMPRKLGIEYSGVIYLIPLGMRPNSNLPPAYILESAFQPIIRPSGKRTELVWLNADSSGQNPPPSRCMTVF